jgi:hypothetical protein
MFHDVKEKPFIKMLLAALNLSKEKLMKPCLVADRVHGVKPLYLEFSKYSIVSVDANHYSVPDHLVRGFVLVKVYDVAADAITYRRIKYPFV